MKNFLFGFLLATGLGVGLWFIKPTPHRDATVLKTAAQKYQCPMHPTFVSDKPGDCPICGMKLVPVEKVASSTRHGGHSEQQESSGPGGLLKNEMVSGYAPVRISMERQQMMGIRVEEVRLVNLEQNIRTVGRVTSDETRLHHVHTKFDGFIEHIHVNFVGQFVQRGDPLFSIYSPELLSTQKEYLLALQTREKFPVLHSEMALSGTDLVESARQRLSLWDMEPGEIEHIEETRQPIRAITMHSSFSGFVSAKSIAHGTKVTPAETLYDIIDLSSVWVLADVYEVNLPFVKAGQPAEITLPYMPGKVLKGRVTYIYPTLDEKTRTVKVRFEFSNPSNQLKPEMYADVELKGSLGKGLVIPASAVISTGERMVVFVSTGEGTFEPREVATGTKVRNFYEIKKGLSEGEKVVTDANFLLDSESKLRAAISGTGHVH